MVDPCQELQVPNAPSTSCLLRGQRPATAPTGPPSYASWPSGRQRRAATKSGDRNQYLANPTLGLSGSSPCLLEPGPNLADQGPNLLARLRSPRPSQGWSTTTQMRWVPTQSCRRPPMGVCFEIVKLLAAAWGRQAARRKRGCQDGDTLDPSWRLLLTSGRTPNSDL